jgi:glycerol-3-phosphate dehydrogenase
VLAAGLVLNDLLSAGRNDGLRADRSIPKGRLLSRDEVLAWFPNLPAAGLNGGALWHDAQVESTERLVLGMAHAAASAGAVLANHVVADSLRREGGRVAGVRATDRLTGDTFDVRARMTLNAAGPEAFRLLEAERISVPRVALVDGMNLVLTRPTGMPVGLAARSDGRFLFLVPWRDRAIAGTAYAPADRAPAEDLVSGFIDDLGRAFPWAGLTRGDVAVVHRGRLPAEAGTFGLRSRALVLDHQERDGTPGLVSVLGVKLTTARGVAEKAVDLVACRLGGPVAACRTAVTELREACALEGPLAERAKIAVRGEMAMTLADAVLRRLDLGTAGRPRPEDLDLVEATLAAELGWDNARRRAEREAVARVYPEPLQ